MKFSCDKGSTTVVFAVAALPLILAAGAALDYSRAVEHRAHLQAAVDSAALSAASHKGNSSAQQAAANNAFARNVDIAGCPLTPSVAFNGLEVTVSATCAMETSFMALAGYSAVPVVAAATASRKAEAAPCVLALHPTDKEAIYLNADSKIMATGCDVQANSSNVDALVGNSNGDVSAKEICLPGGWKASGGSEFTPAPTNCPATADPLAWLPVPAAAAGGCTWNNRVLNGGVHTVNPGVYCGKTELNAGAFVTFNPGVYVMRGEFVVNSGSRATGDGVMFYFMGIDNPRFNFNSDSHVEFKGLKAGPHAGIAIFQERGSAADFSILNSDSSSFIEGVVYLPDSPMHMNSRGSTLATAPWTFVIVEKLEVNSQSSLWVNSSYAASTVPVPLSLVGGGGASGMVRLVQ